MMGAKVGSKPTDISKLSNYLLANPDRPSVGAWHKPDHTCRYLRSTSTHPLVAQSTRMPHAIVSRRVVRYSSFLLLEMERLAALLIIFLASRQRVAGDRFCGVNLDDAKKECWQPCSADSDCCSTAQRCFEAGDCGSADKSGTNHYFCGVSWCDAAYKCGISCPEQTECPDGQSCYADVPCDSESPVSAPPLPVPPAASPYQFCGSSISDAKDSCWQPCPRGANDCCFGLQCFDTSSDANSGGTCQSSDYSGSGHFFCGSSWCDAAYSCGGACPGGQNAECPGGQYCYADVPCSSSVGGQRPPDVQPLYTIHSKYCGESKEDAAEQCWQPCRDDGDCCFGQTCHPEVTTCPYPDNIGADHFFCGSDFCDAAYKCSVPCPTGFDAQCPNGQRCLPNVPCDAKVGSETAETLFYGLPRDVLRLMQQYDPGAGQRATTNSVDPSKAFPVGLVFGLCVVGLLALNYMWSRYTVA